MNDLLEYLRSRNITIELDSNNNLRVHYDEVGISDEDVSLIREHKSEIVSYLKAEISGASSTSPIKNYPKADDYPLSSSQESIWLMEQLGERSLANNVSAVYTINGKVDGNILEMAFKELTGRYEILRTVFKVGMDNKVRQVVKGEDDNNVAYQYVKTASFSSEKEMLFDDIFEAFDLELGPLIRVKLVEVQKEKFLVGLNMHHLIADGWSINLIFKEVGQLYRAIQTGNLHKLSFPSLQYKDYVFWENDRRGSEKWKQAKDYWTGCLNGKLERSTFPLDFERPRVKTFNGRKVNFQVGDNHLRLFKQLCLQNSGTLFMGFISIIYTLLYKYTGKRDLIIGSPVSGRNHLALDDQIGCFVNALPLRCCVESNMSFIDLFSRVRTLSLEAFDFQEYPFENILESCTIQRDPGRSPLFDVFVVQEHVGKEAEIGLDQLDFLIFAGQAIDNSTSRYDVSFEFKEENKSLDVQIEYNTDLFSLNKIEVLSQHIVKLIDEVCKYPHRALAATPLLRETEVNDLIELSSSRLLTSKSISLLTMFEEQVKKTPVGIAMELKGVFMTYSELDLKSNKMAQYLENCGVQLGTKVSVALSRNFDAIVAMLAIFKVGGVYVPVDTSYPLERMDFIIRDSGSDFVLVGNESNFAFADGIQQINIDLIDFDGLCSEANSRVLADEAIAYIIYTSGSSGKPKGVMVTHGNLNHFCSFIKTKYELKPPFFMPYIASSAFDISLFQILYPLLNGGTCIIVEKEQLQHFDLFLKIVEQSSVLDAVPSLYAEFIKFLDTNSDYKQLSHIKRIFIGGDSIPSGLLEMLSRVFDMAEITVTYGPTECTIFCVGVDYPSKGMTHASNGAIIGRPVDRCEIYIMDKDLNLVPHGVEGEICIGGAGVSRGYINLGSLSEERFVSNPYKEGMPLYRTGDLGCWLANGMLEFRGRDDNQVKLRGFRIELSEIEKHLNDMPLLQESVVSVQERGGEKLLVAFCVCSGGALDVVKGEEVQAYLRARLPDYMVPSRVVFLERLPLTVHGKVDRRSLSEYELSGTSGAVYEAPGTMLELRLSRIWEGLLGMDRVGTGDNFFALGGHSLLATRLVSAIRRELGLSVRIRDIFERPTIALLSEHLKKASSGYESDPLVARERGGRVPLSYSQERMWFIDRLTGSHQYHISSFYRLGGGVDVPLLGCSFRELVRRHEALRTVLREEGGDAYQEVLGWEDWAMEEHEWEGSLESLKEFVSGLQAVPFDLSEDYMLRICLFRSGKDYYLFINLHHIACDGWSFSLMVKELSTFYNSGGARLPALPVQYSDYALWQRRNLIGDRLEEKVRGWKDHLSGLSPVALPTDYARPAVQGHVGSMYRFRIPEEMYGTLINLGRREGVTLFMFLLSVFKVLLHRYSGTRHISVGSPVAGREEGSTEDLIGFFVNTLALVSDLGGNPRFVEVLDRVRSCTLWAYDHQDVPFEKVVDAVSPDRDMSHSPLFQHVFVLQGQEDMGSGVIGDVVLEEIELGHETSKFDLTYTAIDRGSYVDVEVEYATDLYTEATVSRMAGHYLRILEEVLRDPSLRVGDVELLSREEEELLTEGLNGEELSYDEGSTIVSLFRRRALERGDARALVYGSEGMSYGELDRASDGVARHLCDLGVVRGDLIPMCTERGIPMLVGILGILKAGGAYVPIDPAYPAERIGFIVEDTGGRFALVDTVGRDKLKDLAIGLVLLEPDFLGHFSGDRSEKLPVIASGDIAYVIYTSGTTGQPKGVMVEHGNVVSLFCSGDRLYDFDERDVWTMFHSYCFDFSVWEMYGALFYGGRLIIVASEVARDTVSFSDLLVSEGVTVLNQTPSAFYVLQDHVLGHEMALSVRYVIFGGEALVPDRVWGWHDRYADCRLVNMYGITETTVHVTYQELSVEDLNGRQSVIGHSLPTLRTYILDSYGHLCPVGVIGELYVCGAGVSRGYLNRPDLTAARFVDFPYGKSVYGKRSYKTGDLARWRGDGVLEYLGRSDSQLKVRGYRIEAGEIEGALRGAPGVREGVVVLWEELLVGYVVAGDGFREEEVQAYLRERLPGYMVPGRLVRLDRIPLTSNGKVDRGSLPAVTEVDREMQYVAPESATERRLAAIWSSLLSVEQVSIHDNFFHLGGDSIKVIKLVSKIKEELKCDMKISEVYVVESLEALAKQIDNLCIQKSTEEEDDELIKDNVDALWQKYNSKLSSLKDIDAIYQMSDIQKGMAYASLRSDMFGVYHDQMVYKLSEVLDVSLFDRAINLLIQKHEILRTAFYFNRDEDDLQLVYHSFPYKTTPIEKDLSSESVYATYIKSFLDSERKNPFDLSKAPLWRLHVINSRNFSVIVFQCHHSILDGWSVAKFNTELIQVYFRLKEGEKINKLPLLTFNHKAFMSNVRKRRSEESSQFWINELKGCKKLTIFDSACIPQRATTHYRHELWEELKKSAKQDKISIKSLFFGAYIYSLSMFTNEKDILVGLVTNVRPGVTDAENILGCFLNSIPFRFQLNSTDTFAQYLHKIESKLNLIKEHDWMSLFEISRIVDERFYGENPFFDTIFNYVDFHVYEALDEKRTEQSVNHLESGEEALDFSETNTFFDVDTNITSDKLQLKLALRHSFESGLTIDDFKFFFENFIEAYIANSQQVIVREKLLRPCDKWAERERKADGSNLLEFDLIDQINHTLNTKQISNKAIINDATELLYSEFIDLVEKCSSYLQNELKVRVGTKVAVMLERSEWTHIILMSLLRTGAVYIPLDPSYPLERLKFQLQDVNPNIVLIEDDYAGYSIGGCLVCSFSDLKNKVNQAKAKGFVAPSINEADISYIIYTSGSTGTPKGVMVSYGSLNNFFANVYTNLTLNKGIIMPFLASISFDISLFQILTPLLFEGTSIVVNNELLTDIPKFLKVLDLTSVVDTVPAVYTAMIDFLKRDNRHYERIQKIFIGGDVISNALLLDLTTFFPNATIIATYGPTEATIFCSQIIYDLPLRDRNAGAVIGRPIINTAIHILNKNLEEVPVGVTGEICISGACVSNGYLNGSALTKEKFIRSKGGNLFYRSGDYGNYLSNGNIAFSGRRDAQVKINGFRIELGEIESILLKMDQIKQAVVLINSLAHVNILEAYIVPSDNYDRALALQYLNQELPYYMVPQSIFEIDHIPLNQNGKLDKGALKSLATNVIQTKTKLEPENETEKHLALVWSNILQRETISIHDNFFELGGHSLLAAKLVHEINVAFHLNLPITIIFQRPTVSLMAETIELLKTNANLAVEGDYDEMIF